MVKYIKYNIKLAQEMHFCSLNSVKHKKNYQFNSLTNVIYSSIKYYKDNIPYAILKFTLNIFYVYLGLQSTLCINI